jgi:hypothetical protein
VSTWYGREGRDVSSYYGREAGGGRVRGTLVEDAEGGSGKRGGRGRGGTCPLRCTVIFPETLGDAAPGALSSAAASVFELAASSEF